MFTGRLENGLALSSADVSGNMMISDMYLDKELRTLLPKCVMVVGGKKRNAIPVRFRKKTRSSQTDYSLEMRLLAVVNL